MWKEGLFLMPHHLQMMDGYHERLVEQRVSALGPHFWGVRELAFEQDELARGILRVSRLRAIMPDGTLVEVGPGCALDSLAVSVPGGATEGRPLEVYLGVPAGATSGTDAGGARYACSTETVRDAYQTAGEIEVECVRPNAQLLFDRDNRNNYITVKLAELAVGDAGRLEVSDRYVPPCLRAGVSQPVMTRLSRLVAALAAKQSDLSAKQRGRGGAMVEFGAADVASFWYLHTVNTAIPVMMHYAAEGEVHPEQLYLALASLTGQLSTFEAEGDPISIARFNYLDLAGTLFPLLDRVFGLLGTVVSARYRQIQLEQTQPGLFVGRIDEPQLFQKALYLLAGGDVPDDTLRDDVPRYVKIGSVDQIADIVQAALPGVGVKIDTTPPAAIPLRAHMIYMRLDKHGRYWDALKGSGSVAIYQPVKPDRVKLELIVVDP